MDAAKLKKLAQLVRYFILTSTSAAGSGHPTSSLSAVELLTTLFFKYLRYDLDNPKHPGNDRVIFSKGHASPLFFALYAAAGKISESELLKYRTFDSPLEGHPSMRFAYTEVPTGSLGQGLGVGLGEALGLKLQKSSARVFVLLGDGELAEGSTWEVASWAAKKKLNNLIAIADINRLGQSENTMFGYDIGLYQKRFAAFGWKTIVVPNGNNLSQVDSALAKGLKHKSGPTIILAKTIKGKGVSFLEGVNGWHGKALGKEELEEALKELGQIDKKIRGVVQRTAGTYRGAPFAAHPSNVPPSKLYSPSGKFMTVLETARPAVPEYLSDKPVATRKAFGNALKRLGSVYPDLVVLDGDVKNSTYTEEFEKAFPDRFFQMYIAEQLMVEAASGLAAIGYRAVAATFACFLSRAHDQIRMAAMSGLPLLLCGSHAGVSIGEDGPSQMGLEDLAIFRALPNSVVVYPADAYSSERLTEVLVKREKGISYIRTSRPATPILYTKNDQFPIGKSKTFHARFRESSDQTISPEGATVVAAGITLHEALKAQDELAKNDISIRVIDCYSVKPVDEAALKKAAKETKAIIVVEDHYPEGGLGEAVMSALVPLKDSPLKVVHLAVRKLPRSGKPAELLDYEEISAKAIIQAVKNFRWY